MATPAAVLAILRAARPRFRSGADALVYALHAALLVEGFVLVAAGPSAEVETPGYAECGHEGWDGCSAGEWAFRYIFGPSGTYVLKALAAGDALMVDVAPPGGTAPAHLELSLAACTTGRLGDGYADVYSDLAALLARAREALLPTLLPKAAAAEALPQQQASGRRSRDPEPEPSSMDDEPAGSWLAEPPRRPGMAGVGAQDLYPPGMPRLPALGPHGPPFGGGNGNGGMLVGPSHPGFFPGGGGTPAYPPQRPPGLPPGARFDPYGPPGIPGFEPSRFGEPGRLPGQPGQLGQQGRPLHPDLAQLGGDDSGADAHLYM